MHLIRKGVERIVNYQRAVNALSDCPRPKTSVETMNDRKDKWSVWVRVEEVLKTINVDGCDNTEEVQMFTDSTKCCSI
jgi:hypothetical protein